MRFLITGGAGYIGSMTVGSILAAGHQVTVFDILVYGGEALLGYTSNPNFRLVKGDIRDRHHLDQVIPGHDVVIHLASVVGEPACSLNEDIAQAINFTGAINVLEAAQTGGVRQMTFVSTCSNYGVSDPGTLVTEDAPLRPLSLYARSKVEAEQRLLGHTGSVTTTVLRFGTICGVAPRMRFDLL